MEIIAAIHFEEPFLENCTEISAASQVVNADIQMNHGSGAATTRCESCNHCVRAAAKAGITYQIALMGSEVWYEEISRKELTDQVMQD